MSPADVDTHRPVLFDEALDALAIREDGLYLDGTFGRGGHSGAILQRLGPNGRLVAMDRDPEAVAVAKARFGDDARFTIEHAAFSEMGRVLDRDGLRGRLDGIFLDLGVSSPQLDVGERGFSFMRSGPLDMRMDTTRGPTAAEWLATAEAGEIADVIRRFGEERHSRRIARAIVEQRLERPLETTDQLAELVAAAVPGREKGKHPATRTFQAIRIFINGELDELRAALDAALDGLKVGGRLVVISFHSLEDRIVKRFMREQARGRELPRDIPVTGEPEGRTLRIVGKPVRAGKAECQANPRARSAVMRVAERLECEG